MTIEQPKIEPPKNEPPLSPSTLHPAIQPREPQAQIMKNFRKVEK